ncbi:MAG: hypothetical protein WA885_24205 [Phormidesmis sp.]
MPSSPSPTSSVPSPSSSWQSTAFIGDLPTLWKADPWLPYYNLNGLTDILLTCDIDWAPDFATQLVIDLAQQYGCKITLFATHASDLLQNPPDHVEVGLHPDFTRVTGKGDFYRKMADLKALYPNAVGTRSHRNLFGQNISDCAKQCGLQYDISTFLWNQPLCQIHQDYNNLTKLCYLWEDGIHLDMGLPFNWNSICLHTPGLKVLNVHPILMYLNSPSEDHRRSVTSQYSDLTIAKKADLDLQVNTGYGIRNVWIEVLQLIHSQGIKTHLLKEVVARASRPESPAC